MDKATLVRSDYEIAGPVWDTIRRAKIPVTLVDWNYVPDLNEWQLVVATPWYDTKGPLEAYSRVIEALQKDGIYGEVPMRRVSVLSPNDSLVQTLEKEIRLRTEGSIYIAEHEGNKHNHQKLYSVLFLPYTGPGDVVPGRMIASEGELRKFLETRLHISRSSIEDAMAELARKRRTLIPNVQLTIRDAKKFKLA